MIPKGVENLIVAGRCISGDHVALSSYREQSDCMIMGEAAGNAAGLVVDRGKTLREISVQELREKLKKNGANIGPES